MSEVMHIPAVLRGEEAEGECLLEVWQESSSTGRVFTCCRIQNAPTDLPDGPYHVVFQANTVSTRKTFGSWELSFLPREVRLDLVA